jgi:hypothetical protein
LKESNMKTKTKLVLAATAGVLSAAIALVIAIDSSPPDVRAPAIINPTVAGGPVPHAPWGRDVLRHQLAARAPAAKPIVGPGIPAFSPPLASERVVPPPPARTTPPTITLR